MESFAKKYKYIRIEGYNNDHSLTNTLGTINNEKQAKPFCDELAQYLISKNLGICSSYIIALLISSVRSDYNYFVADSSKLQSYYVEFSCTNNGELQYYHLILEANCFSSSTLNLSISPVSSFDDRLIYV